MSWVTVIWSMVSAACLTLAVIHFLIALSRREARANLFFALTAVATTLLAAGELWLMRAETPAQFGHAMRWLHVPVWILVLSLVGLVRVYLHAGRPWLAWTVCGLRTISLILNFLATVNLNYRQISAVRRIPFLGEPVSVAVGIPNPWMLVGQLSLVLMLVFVVDAAWSCWQRGDRRQACVVGGGVVVMVLLGALQSMLVLWGVVAMPITVSLFYLGVVAAMGFELSRDVFAAAVLARDLGETELRLDLASEAAGLGLWVWEIRQDEIWISEPGRKLSGVASAERLDFSRFVDTIHPDDREPVREAVAAALANGGDYRAEYRVVAADTPPRWMVARGKTEFTADGQPLRMRGVSVDISARKQVERELHSSRGELVHLSRVNLLGELSGSLAHELNQPLASILSNAQAAQRYLSRELPDLDEVREILADIVSEDQRAGELICRLRLLMTKGEIQWQLLDLNEVVREVIKLVGSDLANHGVILESRLAPGLEAIRGDRVQLQQVVLNLVMNASDAMAGNAPEDRRLTVRTWSTGNAGIGIEISDLGRGLPDGGVVRVFERFFTTKPYGLGLGLSVCHTIVAAHGGTIGAANRAGRGATFHCIFPHSNASSPHA